MERGLRRIIPKEKQIFFNRKKKAHEASVCILTASSSSFLFFFLSLFCRERVSNYEVAIKQKIE